MLEKRECVHWVVVVVIVDGFLLIFCIKISIYAYIMCAYYRDFTDRLVLFSMAMCVSFFYVLPFLQRRFLPAGAMLDMRIERVENQ